MLSPSSESSAAVPVPTAISQLERGYLSGLTDISRNKYSPSKKNLSFMTRVVRNFDLRSNSNSSNSPSVDLSSSNVLEGCEAVDATGGRGWGVGLGDAGLGAEPTEPALLCCPCGTLPPAAGQICPSGLWWTFNCKNNRGKNRDIFSSSSISVCASRNTHRVLSEFRTKRDKRLFRRIRLDTTK